MLAIDASLGICSFDDIRKKKPALHISTQSNDGISYIGFAVDRLLAEAGVPREKILEWGGSFVELDPPDQCVQAVRDGHANSLFYEAVMTPYWRNLARDKALNFIPFEKEVLMGLRTKYGWQTNVLPANALNGLTFDLEAIDWSDWVSIVRPDFPDDVAYVMAWVACNTQDVIERQIATSHRNLARLRIPSNRRRLLRQLFRCIQGQHAITRKPVLFERSWTWRLPYARRRSAMKATKCCI